jgi:uncharacterized protein
MKEKDKWDDSHRLWSLPPSSWKMTQTWNDLLFTHYPIKLEVLRELVPEVLPLDSFNGVGWIGIVTFRMTGVRLRGLPPVPRTDAFPQVNVRTYINLDGKPGVYFVSLDAANRLAASVARNFFNLPYHYADITMKYNGVGFDFNCNRRSNLQAKWVGNYKPISELFYAPKGTFDEWMAERYCFYTVNNKGVPLRCDVLHQPWLLQNAEAEISYNTLLTTQGLQVEKQNPVFHFSKRMEVRAWSLIPALK